MAARHWLIALPLFLLAAGSIPLPIAQGAQNPPEVCQAAAAGRPACPAPRVISIWGGARDSLALMSDGTVWAWGLNNCDPVPFTTGPCGKQGDGSTTQQLVPGQVHGPGNVGFLTSVVAIMGAEHDNYALKADGSVWAWGANFVGQLGDGDAVNTDVPVQVSLPVSATLLGARGYHALAADVNGAVWAWGWNSQGQLGHDTTGQLCPVHPGGATCSEVPVQVLGVSHPLTLTGGGFFSLAVMPDHSVLGWGSDNYGQLADGGYSNEPAPVAASGVLSHVIGLSAGWQHAVALTADGHVWDWGNDSTGEIGNGITATQGISLPYQVPGLDHVVIVSGGDGFTGVLKDDGTVWTWGGNQYGQLGNGSSAALSTLPVQVQGLSDVVLYTARDYHNLAVKRDGTVWAWGSGENGELGNNDTQDSSVPVQVLFPAAPPLPPRLWLPAVQR